MNLIQKILMPFLFSFVLASSSEASGLAEDLPDLVSSGNIVAPVSFGASFLKGKDFFSRGGNHYTADSSGVEGGANVRLFYPISDNLSGSLGGQAKARMTRSDFTRNLGINDAENEEYSGKLTAGLGSRRTHFSGLVQYDKTRTKYFDARNFNFIRIGADGIFSTKEKNNNYVWAELSGGALTKIAKTGGGVFFGGECGFKPENWINFSAFADYESLIKNKEKYQDQFQKTEAGANIVFHVPIPGIKNGYRRAYLDFTAGILYISTSTVYYPHGELPAPERIKERDNPNIPLFNLGQPERKHRTMGLGGFYFSF